MGVHEGHRARMKARFREYGLDNFDDHNVLELLLFYAIPQADVNPLAHNLIDAFGSLAAVFDAPIEELMKINGVGENTATLIKFVPQLARRYMISRSGTKAVIDTPRKAGEYMFPKFIGEQEEVVYLACMDTKGQVISCRMMFRGNINSVSVNVRKMVEYALSVKAVYVILAHNHTSGIAIPSMEDRTTTKKLFDALKAVDIKLVDHIVVGGSDYVSMSDDGFFRCF